MMKVDGQSVAPVPRAELVGVRGYRPQSLPSFVDLRLDANEGADGATLVLREALVRVGVDGARRYPDASRLEARLAERLGVSPARVLVTAGGDDAIDRICRAFLAPGRECVLPVPTFEMIARGARLAGASVQEVEWPEGPFPTDDVVARINDRTGLVAVVSPNNPTGCIASAADLARVADEAARVGALVMLDAAYAEFAGDDFDLTAAALERDNCVVVRTFSKARGLAGLRVGYVAGPEAVIETLRAAGGPFPTSALSLAAAEVSLERDEDRVRASVARVVEQREQIQKDIEGVETGYKPIPPRRSSEDTRNQSRANFVLARFGTRERRDWVWGALMGLGIAVRRFTSDPRLADALRITCPGDGAALARLRAGLRAATNPQAILFDMDGVLADVSRSYRAAIVGTCASWGVRVTGDEIAAVKAEGNANNDWVLSQRLLAARGVAAPLAEVTRRFEALYQGENDTTGLRETESLIPDVALLERLSRRVRLCIVTGRPRTDAERFLDRFALARLFDVVVCMEDGPLKPDPFPVREALRRMNITDAWMIGDTVDDCAAARAAGVVPIGIAAPLEEPSAERERDVLRGATGLVINSLEELEGALP